MAPETLLSQRTGKEFVDLSRQKFRRGEKLFRKIYLYCRQLNRVQCESLRISVGTHTTPGTLFFLMPE